MHINTRLFSLLIGINEYKRNGRALKFAWFLYPSVYFIHAYTHMVYGLGRYFYMRHRTSNKFFIAFLRALNRDRFDWLLFSLSIFSSYFFFWFISYFVVFFIFLGCPHTVCTQFYYVKPLPLCARNNGAFIFALLLLLLLRAYNKC